MSMAYVRELGFWLCITKRLGAMAMDMLITIPFPMAKSKGKAIGISMVISLLCFYVVLIVPSTINFTSEEKPTQKYGFAKKLSVNQ